MGVVSRVITTGQLKRGRRKKNGDAGHKVMRFCLVAIALLSWKFRRQRSFLQAYATFHMSPCLHLMLRTMKFVALFIVHNWYEWHKYTKSSTNLNHYACQKVTVREYHSKGSQLLINIIPLLGCCFPLWWRSEFCKTLPRSVS